MISWIQKYFQHHFKTIFAVLLAVTIISFVFTIGASPGLSHAEREARSRTFFGYNLASQDDVSRLRNDASLSAQLQFNYGALQSEQGLENYAYQRIASLHLADEYHIPATTNDEIATYIKTLPVFQGEDGQFDAKRYANFRDMIKTNPRMNETTVRRVLSDDARAEKLQRLISGPGYALAADVASLLDRLSSTWTIGIATVDAASYNPTITPTDVELAKFFEDYSFNYIIPPRMVVEYADFSALTYIGSITVSEADARAYYDANPNRFPVPTTDPKAPALTDPAAKFAAVRANVESTLKLEQARRLASKAASDFSYAVYKFQEAGNKVVPGTPAFDQLLASQHVALKTLAPFTQADGPAELGGSRDVASEAFKLGANRTYSDAVTVNAGAVVLFWKGREDSRKPTLLEVRAKVAADYVKVEKSKRFVELGRAIRGQIEAQLKAGETFDKAAAAAATTAGVKIEAKMHAPFTLRQPPQDLDNSVVNILEHLTKGAVSDMTIVRDKALLVYAADRKSPDLTEANPDYVATRAQVAALNGQMAAADLIRQVVQSELKRTEPPTR